VRYARRVIRVARRPQIFWAMLACVIACSVLLAALRAEVGSAEANGGPWCVPYQGNGIPPGSGIPPWGFHAMESFNDGVSGSSHGWGDVDLNTNWISGKICQTLYGGGRSGRMISVRVGPRILYRSHVAVMWGYPGNVIKAPIKVISSTDSNCEVGTLGHVTMYTSYNNVKSDSIQFFLANTCRDGSRLYHGGAQTVNAQVPPL
jgi:hypothetical protein